MPLASDPTSPVIRPCCGRLEALFGIDVRSLAAFRVAMALLLLLDLCSRAKELTAHYSDLGVLPRSALLQYHEFSNWHWSLHLISGEPAVIALLFVVQAALALMLLVGFRTRLATVGCFIMLASLQARNPMVLHRADTLHRVLLFWSMFLNLGAAWSVDRAMAPPDAPPDGSADQGHDDLNTKSTCGIGAGATCGVDNARGTVASMSNVDTPPIVPTRLCSVASAALLLQVCFMYWFACLLRSPQEWWTEGSAVYYALNYDPMARPWGKFMLDLSPDMLRLLTRGVFLFEAFGPLLLFVPFATTALRLIAIVLFLLMQLVFGLSFSVGLFPWVSAGALLLFLPTGFWEALARRVRDCPRWQGLKVYYDGECTFCRKGVLLLRTLAMLRDDCLAQAQSDESIDADMRRVNSWVVVDHEGKRHFKTDAMYELFRASPLLFWLAPLLGLAIVQRVGDFKYRWIANHRHAVGHLLAPVKRRPFHVRATMLNHILAGALFVYVLCWNVGQAPNPTLRTLGVIPSLRPVGYLLHIDQNWNIFARVPKSDNWFLVQGTLDDGTRIDLITGEPTTLEVEPAYAMVPGYRWRRYQFDLAENPQLMPLYRDYLLREWQRRLAPDRRLVQFDILHVTQDTFPAGRLGPMKRRVWPWKIE